MCLERAYFIGRDAYGAARAEGVARARVRVNAHQTHAQTNITVQTQRD